MKKIALAISMLALAVSSACVIPQSEQCGTYIACIAHFDDINGTDTTAGIEDSYGEGGTCWQNADTAAACTTACEDATTALSDSLDAAGEDTGDCG